MRAAVIFFTVVALFAQAPVPTPARSGIHPEDIDTTCKPCTDFWRFANGTWLDKNPIPARSASWGPFNILNEANQERSRTILDAAVADTTTKSPNRRHMADLYASCMDTATLDTRGLNPLQPEFERIAAIRTQADLQAAFAASQLSARPSMATNSGVAAPFRFVAGLDPGNPTRVIARIVEREAPGRAGSSIFSLPDRDYYFRDDARSREIRAAFLTHAAKMLELAGASPADAAAQAKAILSLETTLAQPVLTIAERRDPTKIYHLMDLAQLRALAPDYDWAVLLRQAGLPLTTPVNVTEPELLKRVNEQLTGAPLDTWKTWLRWRTLQLSAPWLGKPFSEESFRFERGVLTGVKEAQPRWQTCTALVDAVLPDALGEAWTAKYFPPEAKRRMSQLVENLRASMSEEIRNSAWMQPATKTAALKKLAALQVQIGYPARWRDYSALETAPDRLLENVRAAWAWANRYELAKIGKPASNVDWNMTAPTVNAYSSSMEVKIVFPAGILQPPYFDMEADDAANYGAIGAVIGHEMGHQFDDGGSKYDSAGTLKNWWTDADRKEFETRTSCVVDQFNKLDVGDGLRHNGKMVLGEALGDLGGLTVAYRAWKKATAGKPAKDMDGYTPDQRFFIAYARVWGTQMRPEAMRLQLNTNNHPLAKFRALGTLQNMPEFHKAFNCQPGDPMVRPAATQCKLW